MRRTARWRALDGGGMEHMDLAATAEGVEARAVAVGEREGAAYGAAWRIALGPDWTFRRLDLDRTDGAALRLERDAGGGWTRDGAPAPGLGGCVDIDLSGSPFTNTLPIRRHRDWREGEPVRFAMAWVPLDTLLPFADAQVYTSLGSGRWRFQSGDGSFERVIETDADGLVTLYPGLFERT